MSPRRRHEAAEMLTVVLTNWTSVNASARSNHKNGKSSELRVDHVDRDGRVVIEWFKGEDVWRLGMRVDGLSDGLPATPAVLIYHLNPCALRAGRIRDFATIPRFAEVQHACRRLRRGGCFSRRRSECILDHFRIISRSRNREVSLTW